MSNPLKIRLSFSICFLNCCLRAKLSSFDNWTHCRRIINDLFHQILFPNSQKKRTKFGTQSEHGDRRINTSITIQMENKIPFHLTSLIRSYGVVWGVPFYQTIANKNCKKIHNTKIKNQKFFSI